MSNCKFCNSEVSNEECVSLATVRPVIFEIIKKDYPDITRSDTICINDLNQYRYGYVESIIKNGKDMSHIQKSVSKSILNNEVVAEEPFEKLTFGQKVSDKMASFGGSWKFILSFASILIGWIIINIIVLVEKPFDPYPFILLNLVLSCLAAIQAPVIMMSQNRQEVKDRTRATNDYKVNLKSELELRQLHQKIDNLMSTQWDQMNEILDILKEIKDK